MNPRGRPTWRHQLSPTPTSGTCCGAESANVGQGATIANLVIVKVGNNGKVRLDNDAGGVDLIADVAGYFV